MRFLSDRQGLLVHLSPKSISGLQSLKKLIYDNDVKCPA